MKKNLVFIFFVAQAFSMVAQTIDSEQSTITFLVSNFRVRTVEGIISDMKGTAQFDTDNLEASRFDVSLPVATINTENDKRDTHLKSEDFFEVDTYPTISFISKEISKTPKGLFVSGDLTIKDVTKGVEIPFTESKEGNLQILEGSISIKRRDYNVGEGTSNFMVGNEIRVKIRCVVSGV
ncbi:MAG: YceI family protein [Bacteroidota bacterium]